MEEEDIAALTSELLPGGTTLTFSSLGGIGVGKTGGSKVKEGSAREFPEGDATETRTLDGGTSSVPEVLCPVLGDGVDLGDRCGEPGPTGALGEPGPLGALAGSDVCDGEEDMSSGLVEEVVGDIVLLAFDCIFDLEGVVNIGESPIARCFENFCSL